MRAMVSLMATSKCNHRCKHCYIDYSFHWSPNDIKNIATMLKKKYTVIINGAEILLEPAYLDTYKTVGQQYIFSNGIIFDSIDYYDQLIYMLKTAGIKIICLSHHFDAISALNAVDANLIERITDKLINDKFEINYNTTITVDNYMNIAHICKMVNNSGVKKIKFFILKKSGNAIDINNELYLTAQQMELFYVLIQNARREYSIDNLEIRVAGNFSRNTKKFKCTFGIDTFAITPDHKVYGCVFSISSKNEIGYVDNEGNIILTSQINHNKKQCLIGWQ